MDFVVKSRNIELNEELKKRAEKKIRDRVTKYFDKVIKVEVELSREKNPKIAKNSIVEVTVFTPGEIIRSKDSGSDMFEAIDKVANKLEGQIKKYRAKLIQRGRKDNVAKAASLQEIETGIKNQIVKVKTFTIKPTTPEEAVMQMELLGHDFFVFINSETGNTAVIYKRKDKNYGLIEPSF
ncbi:MAG: putative sigma-54 modulation protein [Actinobacteria bacterium ADurb.Bin346]|nr:MAG: putative sigma-54 modulation protein [Actinobacteria bacterium ADurb.Bin346]